MGYWFDVSYSPISHLLRKYHIQNIHLLVFQWCLYEFYRRLFCTRMISYQLRWHAFWQSFEDFLWWMLEGRKILISRTHLEFHCLSIFEGSLLCQLSPVSMSPMVSLTKIQPMPKLLALDYHTMSYTSFITLNSLQFVLSMLSLHF